MANGEKTYRAGGNMKPPSKLQIVTLIKKAWNGLSKHLIQKSFRVCGIVRTDGSQDDEISVLKKDGIAFAAREELKEKSVRLHQQKGDLQGLLHQPLKQHQSEIEETEETDMDEDRNHNKEEDDDDED